MFLSRFFRNFGVAGRREVVFSLSFLVMLALSCALDTREQAAWAVQGKPDKPAKGKAKPLTVEQLAQLNGVALFGVPLKLNKGRFTVIYPGAGEFDKGFVSRSFGRGRMFSKIADVKNISHRKLLIDGHSKGKATLVGFLAGSALSRFDLVDDYKISFRMRIPKLDARGRFAFLLNHQGGSFVQTNFFQDIIIAATKTKVRTKDKRFASPAYRWFD